jgi:hypothetical protein
MSLVFNFVSPFEDEMNQTTMNKKNIAILGLALILLLAGYWFLSQGPANNPLSLTLAPLILVFAYMIVIPVAIMLPSNKRSKGD